MRPFLFAVIAMFLAGATFAQTPATTQPGTSPQPSFEVASVKPNAGATGGAGGRGTPDPTQLNYTNIPLRLILQRAFDVKDYQIVGPSWLQDFQNTRFDIHAKGAAGTTKEQIPLMLQSLLAERFGMRFHMERRELPAYELVVAKGGVKMKESAKPADEPLTPGNTPDNPGRGGGVATQRDQDGKVELAPGRKGAMVMGMGGALRISARLQSAAEIATLCQNRIGRPVADKTGLTGTYDFNLDFSPNGQSSSGATSASTSGSPLGDLKEDVPPLEVAIQSLGLKLQPAKVMMDVVVIDHIEKLPTAN